MSEKFFHAITHRNAPSPLRTKIFQQPPKTWLKKLNIEDYTRPKFLMPFSESDVLSTIDLLNHLIVEPNDGYRVAVDCLLCWQVCSSRYSNCVTSRRTYREALGDSLSRIWPVMSRSDRARDQIFVERFFARKKLDGNAKSANGFALRSGSARRGAILSVYSNLYEFISQPAHHDTLVNSG